MNNGKICVSICAETADEFIENIKSAETFADVIELRFDSLKFDQIGILLRELSFVIKQISVPLLITFRPKSEGGNNDFTIEQRESFWNNLEEPVYVDLEEDIAKSFPNQIWMKRISSNHDFKEVPQNLVQIYERLKATDADVVKIAAQANEITDSIAVWKLLEKAKTDNQVILPIAMGEAGKWTRILGLAHGAFMTYAALESGNETAPGQISAKDLIETYRVKELNEQTDIYGIIGNPVSQSVSPFMHNAAFKLNNLNAVFIPFEVENLDEFLRRMVRTETREIDLNFKGFSVTIPHKQAIITHLDFIDETARTIGAVNTIKISDGKFYGYNTDAPGFIEPLKSSYGDLKDANVAVLGAGGAARAAIYSLKKEGANVTVYARDLKKAQILAEQFDVNLKEFSFSDRKSKIENTDIIVNTTPLGMKGKFETETPLVAEQIRNAKLVYDLVYNPFETRLMQEAKKADVPAIGGLAMLVAQGMKQFEIWTNLPAPMKEMGAAALRKLRCKR